MEETKRAPGEEELSRPLELTLSWKTWFRIVAVAALLYLLIVLLPLLKLLLFALIVSITLWPLVAWLQRSGAGKQVGVITSALLLFILLGVFVVILTPALNTQGENLIKKLPTFKEDLLQRFPESSLLHRATTQMLNDPAFSDPTPLLKQFSSWGAAAAQGIAAFLISLVVAIYLLADGERVFLWLLAFVAPSQRQNVRTAGGEMMELVGRYMSGQLIASTMCGIFVFTVLALFHAPAAAFLGVLAALCDVLPFLGFFLWSIPSVASALTVSPSAALAVGLLSLGYHLAEAYFIVPRIYRNQLHLSTLTVLVGFMAGMEVGGVIGAIAILPMIASYSVVERIWLKPFLERDTVKKHDEMERKEHGRPKRHAH